MTEEEAYLFDLQGYLVVPGVLYPGTLKKLNTIFSRKAEALLHSRSAEGTFTKIITWGKPFLDLIDNEMIRSYLDVFCGRQFRLDHDYAFLRRRVGGKPGSGAPLHLGRTPFHPACTYDWHGGRSRSGLTVVSYALTDVPPGAGGFVCIPGSHKSHLPTPKRMVDVDRPHPCLRQVPMKAGDVLIFTEAVTHGTLPWTGDGERRTLFLKYTPDVIVFLKHDYRLKEFGRLSARQKHLLRPPYGQEKYAPGFL